MTTQMTKEDRAARIAELQSKFENLPTVGNSTTRQVASTADAKKVVGTIVDVVGADRAFELRGLDEVTRVKLRTGFGIAEGEYSAHQIGQALAMTMRRSKEIEVEYKSKTYVLMNQPGEGTKPSRWCAFSKDAAAAKE